MAEDIWDELLSLCDDADLDAWEAATYWGSVRPKLKEGLEKLKAYYKTIEKQAETLKFLFGDEGVKTANLEKIQIWRQKAERWDKYLESIKDSIPHVSLADYEILEDKIEAVNVLVETAHSHGKMDNSTYSVFKKILGVEG